MRYSDISTAQIKALRMIYDHGPQKLHGPVGHALLRRGLVTRASRGDNKFELTVTGKHTIEQWIEKTGDGPEDLKAMFRFD